MEFDPVVAVILAVIVGLLGYLYYLHSQKRAPLPDLSTLAPLYDAELFTAPFAEKEGYVSAKRAELLRAGRSEDEVSVADVDAEGKRTLNGLLVRRAIAAVERASKVNEEIKSVQALQRGSLISQAQVDEIQAGIRAIEQEHRDIRAEIFPQVVDMTIGLQQRKEARRLQEEKGKDEVPMTAPADRVATAAAAGRPSKSAVETRREAIEKVKQARMAEETYRQLIEEEERRQKRAAAAIQKAAKKQTQ